MAISKISFKILLFILIIQSYFAYDSFRFDRQMNCIQQNTLKKCKFWQQTTTLYRYSLNIFYCFPADSYVLTRNGPVQMKDLKLQDELFSLNLQNGKNQYSPIKAWLHYDPFSLLQYSIIEVKNSSWEFIGSNYHNIAYSNQTQADFKFLKDLNQGDSLISITNTGEDLKVQSTSKKVQKEGLFSPLTQSGTFYIYSDNFDIEEYKKKEKEFPMILVHSLSQIQNPIKNQQIALSFVKLSQTLFGAYQPREDEEYVNPLIDSFKIIFGGDWVNEGGQKIAHRYSSSTSYSATRNRQRQERKKKTMAVFALQTILSDTLL